MPAVLDETTPMQPTSRKGKLRVEIELRLREASDRGVRTIILRAGDFFGGGRGSWFDLVLTKELAKSKRHLSGPARRGARMGLPARLRRGPDPARRDPRNRLVHSRPSAFPATPSPARNSSSAIAKATRPALKVGQINWWMMRTVGSIWKMGRELSEIGYLWQVPHRIDGGKLTAAIGEVPHTPLDIAVTRALRELGAIA